MVKNYLLNFLQYKLEHPGCEPRVRTLSALVHNLTSNYRGRMQLRENTRTISDHVNAV